MPGFSPAVLVRPGVICTEVGHRPGSSGQRGRQQSRCFTVWPPRVVVTSTTGCAPVTVMASESAPMSQRGVDARDEASPPTGRPWANEWLESLGGSKRDPGAAAWQANDLHSPFTVGRGGELSDLERAGLEAVTVTPRQRAARRIRDLFR